MAATTCFLALQIPHHRPCKKLAMPLASTRRTLPAAASPARVPPRARGPSLRPSGCRGAVSGMHTRWIGKREEASAGERAREKRERAKEACARQQHGAGSTTLRKLRSCRCFKQSPLPHLGLDDLGGGLDGQPAQEEQGARSKERLDQSARRLA